MYSIKAACYSNIIYFKFPDGVDNIKDFINYLNKTQDKFVELEVFIDDGCVAPYFIEEKTEKQYWNTSLMRCITEAECFIYTKDEYDEKLKEVIAKKCVNCANYTEDVCEMDFDSHREHISLNGECYGFEAKK